MTEVKIRQANAGDAAEIAGLIRALAEKFITHEFEAEASRQFLSANDAYSVEKNMASGFLYFVATRHAKVIGVAGLKNRSHLYHLFVAEAWQGKGLARKLWERLLVVAIGRGESKVITVNSSNAAVGFYRRLGFSPTGPAVEKGGIRYNPMACRVDR